MGRVPLLLLILLISLAKGQENCDAEDRLNRLRALLESYYLWWDRIKDAQWKDERELLEYLRKHGDRWTSITKREEDRLWYSSSKLFGLGIRWDDKGYVVKVFSGSPAERAGIREGDLIVAINDVYDKSKWRKAIMDIPKGGTIKVELIRGGLFFELEVVKGEFTVPVIEEVKTLTLMGRKVGYVKLSNLTQPAVGEFRKVLEGMRSEKVDILLLDLRDNGGGLISVAKALVDMLVGGQGVMFYLEGRGRNMGVYYFEGQEGWNKPILVLVNKNTASAAELTAVLLKRYAGALVVGERTVGKYVGSNIYQIDDCGNVLRLITFEMKLPDGQRVVSEKGIEPDCPLKRENPVEEALMCFSSRWTEEVPAGQK